MISERARSSSSICNHKYDFRPKLHDKAFNYHFITPILKSDRFFFNINIYLSTSGNSVLSFARLKKDANNSAICE